MSPPACKAFLKTLILLIRAVLSFFSCWRSETYFLIELACIFLIFSNNSPPWCDRIKVMKKKYLIISIISIVLAGFMVVETVNYTLKALIDSATMGDRFYLSVSDLIMIVCSITSITLFILTVVKYIKKKPIAHTFTLINSIQTFVLYGTVVIWRYIGNTYFYKIVEQNNPEILPEYILNNERRLIYGSIKISLLTCTILVLSIISYKLIKRLISTNN